MRRAGLIYNPCAGRWRAERRLASLLAALRRGGFAVEAAPTGGPRDATSLARGFAGAGCEVVFAFGGDGTLREAAAGLLGSETALGPLPGGTVNVVAHALGLPPRPAAAAAALAGGVVRHLDVGLAGGEPFLMLVSAGLDADVLAAVRPAFKRRFGRVAVAAAAARRWLAYDYPLLRVHADGEELLGGFAAFCNLPFYGGRLRLAPGARPDDRRLDLVLFAGRGPAATLAFAAGLLAGRPAPRRGLARRWVAAGTLDGPPGLPVQLDGDALAAPVPLAIGLAAAQLRVLSPRLEPRWNR